jgi:hypothetical protein
LALGPLKIVVIVPSQNFERPSELPNRASAFSMIDASPMRRIPFTKIGGSAASGGASTADPYREQVLLAAPQAITIDLNCSAIQSITTRRRGDNCRVCE